MITQVNQIEGDFDKKMVPGSRAIGEGVAQPPVDEGQNNWDDPPLFRFEAAFWTTVKQTGESSYTAYVTPGWIVDVTTLAGNSLPLLETKNPLNDYGLIELPIDSGESVYVRYDVDAAGKPDPDTVFVVTGPIGETSAHYIPIVGSDGSGAPGDCNWELAHFEVDGEGTLMVDNKGDGTNLIHIRSLASFRKIGGKADVFIRWNPVLGRYETRGVKGISPVVVTQTANSIDISLDPSYPTEFTDTDTVTLVEERAVDPQVHVTERAVTAPEVAAGYSKAFTVRGNGVNGSLSFAKYPDAPVTVMEWRDGLMLTEADIVVTFDFDGTVTITSTPTGSSASSSP
jgi:hypothetical protein